MYIYIYIYTCSIIIYNFDLPGAALQARQSSVQILSIPLRCWTWRLSFKCAIFLGGEVLTIKENSIPKCIFKCGSFQSHTRARINTMCLLQSAISIKLNVVYSALYLWFRLFQEPVKVLEQSSLSILYLWFVLKVVPILHYVVPVVSTLNISKRNIGQSSLNPLL